MGFLDRTSRFHLVVRHQSVSYRHATHLLLSIVTIETRCHCSYALSAASLLAGIHGAIVLPAE